MDNHEEKDDALNKQPDAEGETPNEDIPLWLQGIEESALDETKPIEHIDAPTGSWIHEVDNNISDLSHDIEQDLSENTDPDQNEFETEFELGELGDEIPDHQLNSEGSQDESLVDDFINVTNDLEGTEEMEIHALADDPFQDLETDFSPITSEDGFVDISGADLPEQPVKAEDILDDELLNDGELPEWLQDMIAESEQEPETAELVPNDDLDFGQVAEEKVFDLIDIEENIFTEDDFAQQDEDFPPSVHQDSASEPDYALIFAEEDTTPISLSSDEAQWSLPEEELTISDDDVTPQDEVPEHGYVGEFDQDSTTLEEEPLTEYDAFEEILVKDDIPASLENAQDGIDIHSVEEETQTGDETLVYKEVNTLDRAKNLIDEGQIDEALPIINNLIEDPSHLEELEAIVREMAENEKNATSAVMETLGDIALKQNKAHDALDAYAKALNLLLADEEVSDGIG